MTETCILVLNWNNAPDTLECLKSLEHLNCPADVVVVDNGSTDDSVVLIQQQFPNRALLETRENLGYAGGNNFGIQYALDHGAKYVCILNNDVIVDPDCFAPLAIALEQDAQVGVVTPLVAEMNEPDKVWALGQEVNWQTSLVTRIHAGESAPMLRSHPPIEVDAASGTVMMIKREVFEHVGLLDESFYLYHEETDWCLRARQAGYKILAVPASLAWHAVSGTLGQTSPVVDYYMLRNHLRLIARHWTGTARLRILASTVLENLRIIAAYTAKPWGGKRLPHRNARVLALRDALLGRWGKMGTDVVAVCYPNPGGFRL
jgi:GT2 family glycosyltransferase